MSSPNLRRTEQHTKVKRDDLIGAQNLSFSRSSFFTLMVAEIIWQAIVMVNDVGVREKFQGPERRPGKLRCIILTLPPAMPVQEQRLCDRAPKGR